MTAFGFVAEQPPLEQRVLVREVGDRVLQRRDLRRRLGLHADELGLERGDQRGQLLRRQRASARIGSRARHESTYTDRDLVVQAEMCELDQ
jgi:hypothetical protein